MIFRQLFEPESSTYTYLLGCPETRKAVLIDPVLETIDRDLAALQELELELAYTLETHVHADHVTSACYMRSVTGSKVAYPAMDKLPCADVGVSEVQPLAVGALKLQPLFTPGHTDAHHTYLVSQPGVLRAFTGDALLIDGCGRTDFQNGDSVVLYRSVTEKIFSLPGDGLIYPAHDYNRRHVSTVAQERERNPRLAGKTVDEFVAVMGALDLPYPKKIDIAVPANKRCGDCPTDLPELMRQVGGKSEQG
jgi:glyoxylase-like metal-dependent hydrolase (beta-lactamase superfamily II)